MMQVDFQLNGVAALKKSQVNNALRLAFKAMVLEHHKEHLPEHFGSNVRRRYPGVYEKRKGEDQARRDRTLEVLGKARGRRGQTYSHRKLRAVGHLRPLEFTGDLMDQLLGTPRIVVTRKGGRIKLPRKANFRHPQSKVRILDELRAIRPDELAHLSKVFADHLRRLLRALGAKKATVITSLETVG